MRTKAYRSIEEVGEGDFVKTGIHHYEEIHRVIGNLPKRWEIETKSGRTISMFDALSYHKKEDMTDD